MHRFDAHLNERRGSRSTVLSTALRGLLGRLNHADHLEQQFQRQRQRRPGRKQQ